jgi:acid phosphatase
LPVCRAPSGIPLFSNVYVILMENTSLSTLTPAMKNGTAPHLASLAAKYATGSDYHGVDHPSLPNYIALTSGGTQGVGCDCKAQANAGSCNALNCNLLVGSCSCVNSAMNLADQLEAAQLTWRDFGEDMNTPCNVVDSGNYAVRHNPFLYYNGIQSDANRCATHVVDFAGFDPGSPMAFNFIAPNLIDDMHNPDPTDSTNIPNGDAWIGPHVDSILGSAAYAEGGLLVVVWDEDDGSGGITGTDDPVPIFVMSPFAKNGGYASATKADHYSLLATFEDGLGLARLGSAASATPLVDYFPAQ